MTIKRGLIILILVLIIGWAGYFILNNFISDECNSCSLILESSSMAIEKNPSLINLPRKGDIEQLRAYLVKDGKKTLLDSDKVNFIVYHPVTWRIDDASEIISLDSDGVVRYEKEGYVFVKATSKKYDLTSNEVIVATGDIYGDVAKDDVIAVFPSDYKPYWSEYTFGEMMENYPNYMKIANLAYETESKLYGGFLPYGEDKQILALLDIPDHCGGNNNPLETAPCCYMNCDNGEPHYDVIVHEMGHNFADGSKAMRKLLFSNEDRINKAGFGECVASMPVQYLRAKILENPSVYGFTTDDYEYKTWAKFQEMDNVWNKDRLERFEGYIAEGKTQGVFDIDSMQQDEIDSLQGNVGAFCTFFVTPASYPEEFGNKYGWDFYERFLNIFGDNELPDFQEDKVETYFAVAYSVALETDMRVKLRGWGFTIDDDYYDSVYPKLLAMTS